MAEEDLIFGKNRHMFGGIEPSNMLEFSIVSKVNTIKLLARLPKDTIIDGQTLCTVAGAVIRRRADKSPVDEFDGDLVADIKTSNTITDSAADLNKSYYYAAFPYTTQGVYNRNSVNVIKYNPTGAYLYGYDLDTNNPDPDARVTYPSDVDNELFKPAKMNFTNDTFSYGSWPSTAGEGFMPKPCALQYNGTVRYYLDPLDYTRKADGSNSDYDNTDANVNMMMEWPKIYTKRELVNGIYKFRCSPIKIDNSYECWCNYNASNREIDHFYTSIYKRGDIALTNGTSRLRSLGTSGVFTGGGMGADDVRTRAKNNGTKWDIEVLADHLLIQDLLVMMAKTTDLKEAYGYGLSGTTEITSAGLEKKGLFYGSSYDRIKVFGMVDYWDSKFGRRIAGWMNVNGVQKVKLTAGTKDGSTASDYNTTGAGYLTIPDAYGGSGGYISKCRVANYGRIPIVYGGSKTTYECDYISNTNVNTNFAIIAGALSGSENYGPFGVNLKREGNVTLDNVGASLSCKP